MIVEEEQEKDIAVPPKELLEPLQPPPSLQHALQPEPEPDGGSEAPSDAAEENDDLPGALESPSTAIIPYEVYEIYKIYKI